MAASEGVSVPVNETVMVLKQAGSTGVGINMLLGAVGA